MARWFGGAVVVGVPTLVAPNAGRAQHFPGDADLELMLPYLVEDARLRGVVPGADAASRPAVHPSAASASVGSTRKARR